MWPLLFLLMGLARAEETCLTTEDDPYLLFGAKTAYTFAVRGLPNIKAHDVPGCQPKAFWMLDRQGSHNPEANELPELQKLIDLKNNMATNYKNGAFRDLKNKMCTADFNLLQMWQWNNRLNASFAGDLTSDGYMNTQQLAKAWLHKFPGLLTKNQHNYLFKFGSDQRSKTSFRAFTEGLFGDQAEGFDIPKENDEKLIYPYKSCHVWSRDIEENNDTLAQMHIFESKMEFKEMLSNISQRLSFNYDVQKETIMSIYEMCRYNKAWDIAKISPWCAAFSHEDLKRLEYAEDLRTYYTYGYGNSALTNKIGCLPIKDMYNFFANHISEEIPHQPLSMITFTDEPMLLMTLVALNGHHDSVPLTGDNYRSNAVQARKWTTSTMAPFNGNLAAVLYKCTPNGNFQIKDEYQVLFLQNEKPMNMEECRVGLCDWSLVKHKYGELVSKCDLEFCNSAARFGAGVSVLLVVLSRLLA